MSSIYLERVALRTVQLVNVECLALTRANQVYRSSLHVVDCRISMVRWCDEYPSSGTMYAVHVIATPLVFSFGNKILEQITECPIFRSQLVIKR